MLRRTLSLLLALGIGLGPATGAHALELKEPRRLYIGVGDRLTTVLPDGKRVPTLDLARQYGLDPDMLQLWLTRDWKPDWLPSSQLRALARRGVTPVVVHYWFGDDISRERFEAAREEWYSSLWNMAQAIRGKGKVLVVLEPEFNQPAPPGETSVLDWPGFADDLRAAARMIREQAPNALVGVCPGDFPGPPRLEGALGPVAAELDFIAFQEMRAATDREVGRRGYLRVGEAALAYARYLQRAFGRPLLIAYVAVSSHGGWEGQQKEALRDLVQHRAALLEAGVFGALYFQLRDDPRHVGYFGDAETSFGLVRDDGSAKPALDVLRKLGSVPAAVR